MRVFLTSCMICLVAQSFASAAGAYGSIDLETLHRPGPNMGNGGRFDFDIVDESALALPAGWDFNRYDSPSTAAGGLDGTDDLYSFCTETSQGLASGTNTYMVDPTSVLTAAQDLALNKLGDHYWDLAVLPGNGAPQLSGSDGLYNDAEQAGAFQLAVWSILGQAASGSYTPDAIALAATWLASLPGLSNLSGTSMVLLEIGSRQDQITQIHYLPEATSLLVWSVVIGVAGLVLHKRKQS